MRTINKSYLPEFINAPEGIYKPDYELTAHLQDSNWLSRLSIAEKSGKKIAIVNVLHNNLKGKTDLNGNPYKPTRWVFTTKNNS